MHTCTVPKNTKLGYERWVTKKDKLGAILWTSSRKKVQSLVGKADEHILRDISELVVDPKEGV